ncbi:type VI secretion system lipoprotein TssJ [Ralstonia soli]|uniref:Type VI secretion system lipoprotein TssJ n=1 Tax=Ralstonia soli TaxID=2953896 RepID=A0ABT1AHA0_9RALS|nr:type VI secretion system lipoprotein TssJ [Ralstonia soli]MCO5397768.1 type VI secretion system lipoprotein TssJ [Ralstonia soli]
MNAIQRRIVLTAPAALTAISLAGCGVGQAIKDNTVDAAKWAFTTQVKSMNIDLDSRIELNPNGQGQPLSTVVRLYQLKTAQSFEAADYAQLQSNDLETLKPDLLTTKDVVLCPGAAVSVAEPMNEDAEFVGVVAFFRKADQSATWKLVIPKKQWKKTDPVRIVASGSTLALAGANPAPVNRTAPIQSAPNASRTESASTVGTERP